MTNTRRNEKEIFNHFGVRRDFRPDGSITRAYASAQATRAWATRPGQVWPGSSIAGHRVRADFDRSGDLVDLTVDGRSCPAHLDGSDLLALLQDLQGV